MANKHMKIFSTLLVITDLKTKNTIWVGKQLSDRALALHMQGPELDPQNQQNRK
jgi:hypothetical protein